jgi:hypothetical protein
MLTAVVVLPRPLGCGAFRFNASGDSSAVMNTRSPAEDAVDDAEFWTEERMRSAQPAPMPNAWCSFF